MTAELRIIRYAALLIAGGGWMRDYTGTTRRGGDMRLDITAIAVAALAAPGLWNLLTEIIQRLFGKRDVKSTMLLGLGHDRIVYLGLKYIERGWITHDEFENLHDYLYVPYTKLGGNGTAKKVMEDVKRLPMKG